MYYTVCHSDLCCSSKSHYADSRESLLISTVALHVQTNSDQLFFYSETKFLFLTKQPILMRMLTVMILPLQ